MMKYKISNKYFICIIIVFISLILFLSFIIPLIPTLQGLKGRKILLYKINKQELLKAGRELISKSEEKVYKDRNGENISRFIISKDVEMPKIIRMLRLMLGGNIEIESNQCLILSFGNRITGIYGVYIYPYDFNEHEGEYKYGDKMLIPGLWYYDDGYDEFGSEYDRFVDSMIKTGEFPKK